MKKLFTLLTLALLGMGQAWATEETISLTSYTVENNVATLTSDNVTITLSMANGNAVNGADSKGRGFRFQNNRVITIELASGQKINTVKLTAGKNGNSLAPTNTYTLTDGANTLSGSWDTNPLSTKKDDYTWTATTGTNYSSWVMTNTSSGDIYIASITVNYEAASTANAAPTIVSQPAETLNAYVGYEASLTVGATGIPSPSYQWYSNTTASNEGGTAIEGATSATYTFTPAATGTYYYYAVATNTFDETTHTSISNVSTVTVGLKYKVNWSVGESGAIISHTLAQADYVAGTEITLPTNHYFYTEGKSVSKWSDGTNEFDLGAKYTVNSDVTFVPVFADNAKALGDEETSITWTFRRDEGAPSYAIEGESGSAEVIGTTANGIDLSMVVNVLKFDDSNRGKFNNTSDLVRAQVNKTTTFTIPAISGMTVKYTTTNGSLTTNDDVLFGEAKATSIDGKNYVYTYEGSDATLTISDMVGNHYPTGITVTYPLIPTVAPEAPTFPTTTAVNGGSEITLTSGGLATYYQWSDSEVTLTIESTGWQTGTKVTVPNEAGTKYLYAYASNGEGLNSDVVSQAFTIIETASVALNEWYFTAWSEATKAGLIADTEGWNQWEKTGSTGTDFAENGRSNVTVLGKNTLKYGETIVAETKGLKFTAGTYGMGLIFNINTSSIAPDGGYHGSSYIWLYGKNSTITIPDVPAGATIAIGVESHKGTDARGVTLNNATQTKGEAKATLYQDCEWTVTTAGDITITPTSGLHIYYIKVIVNAPTTVTKNISAAGYATFCSEYPLDFTGSGVTAYIATMDGTTVEFSSVTSVPANTGVLLKGEAGEKTFTVAASTTDVSDNKFVGVLEETEVDGGIYVLMAGSDTNKGTGFYKTNVENKFTVGANTAYLPADVVSEARTFIGFDEATAIEDIAVKAQQNGEVYNLQGVRVAQPTKGLYIVNGKKMLVK